MLFWVLHKADGVSAVDLLGVTPVNEEGGGRRVGQGEPGTVMQI